VKSVVRRKLVVILSLKRQLDFLKTMTIKLVKIAVFSVIIVMPL